MSLFKSTKEQTDDDDDDDNVEGHPDCVLDEANPNEIQRTGDSHMEIYNVSAAAAAMIPGDDEETVLPPSSSQAPKQQLETLESTRTPSDIAVQNNASRVGQTEDAKPSSSTDSLRSMIYAGIEAFKHLYSLTLLIFCIVLVMGAIFTEQTTSTASGFPSVAAFFIFWFLIFWLAMMEGGQGALVGLQPIDRNLYKESHPRTYKITGLVHNGDNMDRFIVGRQFLVVLVIFVSQIMSAAIPEIELWGISNQVTEIFLSSGLAGVFVTIVVGQLTAQLNSANCMLDFCNNYFMLYVVSYLSLAIEYSGLLHSAYLVQIIFAKISGHETETNEPTKSALQRIFFWLRVLCSLALLGFAFAVTLTALFQGLTSTWESVPESISVIIFFVLMCIVGLMEGMQIALFAVLNVPMEEIERKSTIAFNNCRLAFRGKNLQMFLIGRQICVTICMSIIAQITTIDAEVGVDANIFGVSDGVKNFFKTGLLGALITTIVASLAWRIIASSFPVAFLSNPMICVILRLCLLVEASGICSASLVLARCHKQLVKYQVDEVYLERTESQSAEPTKCTTHDPLDQTTLYDT